MEPENKENCENSCIEEIFENKIVENTFNEQNSEVNQKQQIETKENVDNSNNSVRRKPSTPRAFSTQLQIYWANFNE